MLYTEPNRGLSFHSGNPRVSGMETNGPIDASEASAALAAMRSDRSRLVWGGYPTWYWLTAGANAAALFYMIQMPGNWAIGITMTLGALLLFVTYAAGRVRGVCEGWVNKARTRSQTLVLWGPLGVVMLVNAVVAKFVPWSSIVAAVLEFVVFAGTGILLSARAARR